MLKYFLVLISLSLAASHPLLEQVEQVDLKKIASLLYKREVVVSLDTTDEQIVSKLYVLVNCLATWCNTMQGADKHLAQYSYHVLREAFSGVNALDFNYFDSYCAYQKSWANYPGEREPTEVKREPTLIDLATVLGVLILGGYSLNKVLRAQHQKV